jgi:flagellar assembly protein FliH
MVGNTRVLPAPPEPALVRREAEDARVRAAIDESYRRGREEGEGEARRDLSARAAESFEWLAKVAGEITAAKRAFLANAEQEVVELALALARRILAREVTGSTDSVKVILREVLAGVADRNEITIRVSPETIDAIRVLETELGQVVSAPENVRWVPDRRVAPWGVVVETETGKIDASVEAQLDEAATLFKEVVGERSA